MARRSVAAPGSALKKAQNTPAWIRSLEAGYARFLVNRSSDGRLKVYRKLMSLLANRFSLTQALERCYDVASDEGRKATDPMAIAIREWTRKVHNGDPLSVALKGWAPARERMMMAVGDVTQLELALENVIKVAEGSKRMVGPLVGALAYPMFLFAMAFVIIAMIGLYMVPPMVAAAPFVIWTGAAAQLVDLSDAVVEYWWIPAVTVPPTVIVIFMSMPLWTGRMRVFVDNLPPWSMYRTFVGVGWLLSLSALVKAGVPVSQAMVALRGEANPYLAERIDKATAFINNGENLGDALYLTRTNFPDKEMIGDLRVYSELDKFEDALEFLANEWLEGSVERIQSQAGLLNTGALLTVGGVIGWAVFGVFQMQNQISESLG